MLAARHQSVRAMQTLARLVAIRWSSLPPLPARPRPALDGTFGTAGTAIHAHSEFGVSISSIRMQPDGNPMIAGTYRIRTNGQKPPIV